jgi:hypothetical protein
LYDGILVLSSFTSLSKVGLSRLSSSNHLASHYYLFILSRQKCAKIVGSRDFAGVWGVHDAPQTHSSLGRGRPSTLDLGALIPKTSRIAMMEIWQTSAALTTTVTIDLAIYSTNSRLLTPKIDRLIFDDAKNTHPQRQGSQLTPASLALTEALLHSTYTVSTTQSDCIYMLARVPHHAPSISCHLYG